MSDKPTVVITGGLGFIGAQVSKTFASAGYDVMFADTNTSRKWVLKVLLYFHMNCGYNYSRHFEMIQLKAVIHLA